MRVGVPLAPGGIVHLAWHDRRDPCNSGMYCRYLTDRGATWLPEENLSRNTDVSTTPSLAAATHYLHTIWLDDRTGRSARVRTAGISLIKHQRRETLSESVYEELPRLTQFCF